MNLPTFSTTLAFLQNIGWMEMMVIMVLLLVLFGRRLPEVGKSLGKGIVEFKKGVKGIDEDVESNSSKSSQPYNQQPHWQNQPPQQMQQYPQGQGNYPPVPQYPQGHQQPQGQPGYQGQTYPAQSPWQQGAGNSGQGGMGGPMAGPTQPMGQSAGNSGSAV